LTESVYLAEPRAPQLMSTPPEDVEEIGDDYCDEEDEDDEDPTGLNYHDDGPIIMIYENFDLLSEQSTNNGSPVKSRKFEPEAV